MLLLDKVLALFTLSGLSSTCFNVVNPDFDTELLLAVLALLGSHITILFMGTELRRWGSMRTELALDWFVCCLFMFFSISLGYHIATLTTFVIAPCATNLMHTDLTDFNSSLTSGAHLRFFLYGRFRHDYFFTFFLTDF